MHPGYGFLSENAAFARRCAEAGIAFVGPSPEALELFGDKVAPQALAQALRRAGARRAPTGPTTLEEAKAFFASLGNGGAVMVKAVAGGGGRGMRPVRTPRSWRRPMRAARPRPRPPSATTASMSSG